MVRRCIDKMYLAFARSNFQQEVFEVYHDLICFGTACLMVEEDEDDINVSLQDTLKNFTYKKIKKVWSILYIVDLKCQFRQR